MTGQGVGFVGTIARLDRMGSSVNGNPRWRVTFEDGRVMSTQVDAAVSYGLGNRGNVGVPVRVQATAAGRIWGVSPVES